MLSDSDALKALEPWLGGCGGVAGIATLALALWYMVTSVTPPPRRQTGPGARWLRAPILALATLLFAAAMVWLWWPLPFALPVPLRGASLALGAPLYFPALGLYLLGLRTLGVMFAPPPTGCGVRLHAGHQLITTVPYALVRHPMYLAVIAAGIGWLLLYRTWAMLAFAAAMFGPIVRAPGRRRRWRLSSARPGKLLPGACRPGCHTRSAQEGDEVRSNRRIRYAVREILSLAGMGVALFWSAGRLDWWPAWAALAVMAFWIGATAYIVLYQHPELLAERLGPRPGKKRWDAAIVGVMGLVTLVRYILAGLDQRYGWTGGFPVWVQLAALALCVLGNDVLFVWPAAANAFFSRITRIQSERGHRVVTGGPYRYMRHPAYAGSILYELAVPILLASWPALIASGVSTLLLILRTALEDRTLQAELSGYADYARRVRYCLLPGIW